LAEEGNVHFANRGWWRTHVQLLCST